MGLHSAPQPPALPLPADSSRELHPGSHTQLVGHQGGEIFHALPVKFTDLMHQPADFLSLHAGDSLAQRREGLRDGHHFGIHLWSQASEIPNQGGHPVDCDCNDGSSSHAKNAEDEIGDGIRLDRVRVHPPGRRNEDQHGQHRHIRPVQEQRLPGHHVALEIEENHEHRDVHDQLFVGLPWEKDRSEGHHEGPDHQHDTPIPPVYTKPVQQKPEKLHECVVLLRAHRSDYGGVRAHGKKTTPIDEGSQHPGHHEPLVVSTPADHR
mmetsp:Transcript_38876/g.87271  ORF Transcript_38876/g.87271 Transcript_38876/m.87271 type:complete len:265 (-) Transcript_38876:853-1647(-)